VDFDWLGVSWAVADGEVAGSFLSVYAVALLTPSLVTNGLEDPRFGRSTFFLFLVWSGDFPSLGFFFVSGFSFASLLGPFLLRGPGQVFAGFPGLSRLL